MKHKISPILALLAGAAMYGQDTVWLPNGEYVWLPNGEYLCGRIDAKGHLVPDLRDCNVPTQAEIDAHKPKPAAAKTGVPIAEQLPKRGIDNGLVIEDLGCDECNPMILTLELPKPKPYSLSLRDDDGQFFRCSGHDESCERKEEFEVSSAETTVVKLSDEEYNHLIWLRAAVTAEETRLAAKYGADPGQGCSLSLTNATQGCLTIAYRAPEHYEFHGAFLLIDHAQVIGDIRPGIDMNSPRVKFMESLPSDGVSESGSHITPKGAK